MLKKRIIPCLDIKDGRTVKGVNFTDLKDAGDPVDLAKKYAREGADELVFLDISATLEKRKTLIPLVQKIGEVLDIPFTVGGGIDSVDLALEIINAGADKISINSSAVKRPKLISELSNTLGNQAVVVAIDAKLVDKEYRVFTKGGTNDTGLSAIDWARKVEDLGAGEILLTSMDHDGVKDGFALELTHLICENVELPIIASGGAGAIEHFQSLFTETKATAGLAASIFHFGEIPIPLLKTKLIENNVKIRN
ncbi:MAG: imidazole glycerol phosphate synthase subunit HisF [Flavobacteriales bacterium]|nr:imidazole glycerol phosphate synthase subunit HisF [Flavobacteriales bacterium]